MYFSQTSCALDVEVTGPYRKSAEVGLKCTRCQSCRLSHKNNRQDGLFSGTSADSPIQAVINLLYRPQIMAQMQFSHTDRTGAEG